MSSVYRTDGGVWLLGQWKGKKPRFSITTTKALSERVRNQILGDTVLRNPFSSFTLFIVQLLTRVQLFATP